LKDALQNPTRTRLPNEPAYAVLTNGGGWIKI
jgi:hypothetical protein